MVPSPHPRLRPGKRLQKKRAEGGSGAPQRRDSISHFNASSHLAISAAISSGFLASGSQRAFGFHCLINLEALIVSIFRITPVFPLNLFWCVRFPLPFGVARAELAV